jgi:hypothetical protein
MKRSILAALLCGLICATASPALEPVPTYRVSAQVSPATVDLGTHVKISGHVTVSPAGVGDPSGVRVVLYVQRFPYRHSFRAVAARRTNATGAYAFRRTFDRNTRVRVRISGTSTLSQPAQAQVLPRTQLSNRLSKDGRKLRSTVTARSPRDVRLSGRVDIYLGRYGAKRLRKVSRPVLRRVGRGLARASVLLNLPASYNGGYNVVSCYAAPASTGMRERGYNCPRVANSDDARASLAATASYRP